MRYSIKNIIITLTSILLVAVLGTVFVNLGMDWFNGLVKPNQWILNIIIPIVWTIIYLAFAVVLTLWQLKNTLNKKIVILLILNGLLNVLWCLIFFALHLTLLGNITIIINLIAGILLINEFKNANITYWPILIIYPIWLSIATALNTALWILN
mgnify:CR=1 FL=1